MVIVLAIGSKVRGFKPGRGRWIFKGDKILSTSFGREVKPAVQCRNILRHVKDPCGIKEIRVAKFTKMFHHVFAALLLYVSAGYCQRVLVGESGMIKTQIWKRNILVMVAVYGTSCAIPHHKQ
jgi:hypothetical protein